MERQTVELSALVFQALLTGLLSLVYLWLWREQRRPYYRVWAAAWGCFALRLGFISAFVATRREIWLFAHQAATGITALLLLWAALVFARGMRWRRRYLWLGVVAVGWAYFAIFHIRDMKAAGISSAIALATVTFGTGIVFWRHRKTGDPLGSTVLAWTFLLWGLHHLDYPLLRALGTGILYGVFADVVFIVAATTGTLLLVLGDDRRALEARAHQLEQLSGLLLRAQEEERRRIARELHDEAGQILTAVKIELDLEGRREAGEMVGRALAQVRDLSNLLRPAALDLGLVPALQTLAEDFERRTRIGAELRCPHPVPPMRDELQVAIYRVTQEALTNVARHSAARHVDVQLDVEDGHVHLSVQDDGRGANRPEATPHLGLLGIRERVTALGGTLLVHGHGAPGGSGFRLEATIPVGAGA